MLRRAVCRLSPTVAHRRAELTFPNLHGFEVVNVRHIDDLNIAAYEMRHISTGASYYHVDANDVNNTFCIGFRTPAENDKGTSHVLEHTTLCGSRKYPIRDPFFMMLKRSLSNFMNAMTGADYTLYPFSTTNPRDFQNLLDVYLDAVFHPLLREEDFKQEGHRVELAESGKTGERRLVNNGVVFNEMRGVVSEPDQFFSRSLMRVMLPGTHYTYVSGGYPPDVLKLTYEELVSFHRRHYHPSNSITFTYGNQHPEVHLRKLDDYFRTFDKSEPVPVPILDEAARFTQPKTTALEGPLDVMGNPTRQKRIAVSYAIPQEQNKLEDVVAFSVMDALLSSGPSSPMFKALIDSQIGSKYSPMKGYAYYLSTPVVSYGVSGVDETREGAEDEVNKAITTALEETVRDGFDKRRVQSVIFQEELQQRHRAAEYGLNLCAGLCAMGLCRSQNDPIDFINWLPQLRALGKDNGASLLPRITEYLLQNKHRATISVSAKEGSLKALRAELDQADDMLNASATEDDKERIAKETEMWLTRVRGEQDAGVLPTLTVSDIPPMSFAEPVPVRATPVSGCYTLPYATNGLVYVHGLAPLPGAICKALTAGNVAALPQNMSVLMSLLGRTGAGQYSFKEHSIVTELVCGGFSFSPILNESYQHKGVTVAGTGFGFYTTMEKLKEALELFAVTLLEPRTSVEDADVYSRVLSRAKSSCSAAIQKIQHDGSGVAVTRAVAELTMRGAARERWYGLTHSRHASEVLEQLQASEDVTRASITALCSEYQDMTQSFAAGVSRGVLWATCEDGDRLEVERLLQQFQARMPSTIANAASETAAATHLTLPVLPLKESPVTLRESLPIDTSYVGYAVPGALDWSHPDMAAVRVGSVLLVNEYLHRRVREEGGAYGARCQATLQGEVGGIAMSSYRDPSPDATLQAFKEAGEWVSSAKNITAERVNEAKLRLFSSIDAPYAADSFGESYFLNDIRQDLKQRMREGLLSVTPADVVRAATYFEPTPHAASCTLLPNEGNEDK